MNLLTPLPQFLIVKGEKIKINTGFKAWFKFAKDLKQSKTDEDILNALKPLFLEEIDLKNIDEIYLKCFEFFTNSKSYINENIETSETGNHSIDIAYDIEIDSNYIFAAFYEQYGIDLTVEDIHYYKFVALFDSLNENTLFKRIVAYRTMDLSKIDDSKLRASYAKLKQLFEINENSYLTKEEIEEKIKLEQVRKDKLLKEWGV